MSRFRTVVIALASLVSLASHGSGKAPVFVSAAWLSDHLNDPNLVILNVSQNKRDFRRGHIPGARFLWVTSMAASNQELSFELPPLEQLDTVVAGLGISNDSRIILCGVNGNVSATGRIYITLEYLGLGDQTSILDGGFDIWKAENRAVSKEDPRYERGHFTRHLVKNAIVDADFVKDNLKKPGVTIVDARAPQFFRGIGGGFPRPGHIPGARNLYFTTLVDTTNKFLSPDSLQSKFARAGVHPGDEIITYCHVGQTASTVYVAAKSLGYSVHLYDGSFEDWSGRDDLPVELPADSLK